MSRAITRRTSLRQLAAFTATSLMASWPRLSFASDDQPTPTENELAAIATIATSFMRLYDVPGLSIAIARHGAFVYRKAFGFANKGENEIATPASLFRICSISKPITSVAIFTLVEAGKLKLNDRVFGTGGILGFDYATKYPDLVQEITIDNLLTQTSGGWDSYENDPTFFDPKAGTAETISWYIRNDPLRYPPGQHYAYSNLGFAILGCVIEKVSRRTYSQYVQQEVFARCGVTSARIMGNTRAERAPGEVIYYGETDRAGGWVHPYTINLSRFPSTGGWIASASDIVRFAMHVDGFTYTPNILSKEIIDTMTTPCMVSPIPHYARGWFVNDIPNWWHFGELPGSMTELLRTASGLCCCVLANTHTEGIGPGMGKLLIDILNAVPEWHAIPAPSRPQT